MKTTYKISCLPPTLILIALTLTHCIDWSWMWVLSPIWIPIVIVLGVWLIFLPMSNLLIAVLALLSLFDRK